MMFIERIIKSPERLALMGDGQSKLFQAGYFEAAFELATEMAGEMGGANPIESAALQRAFIKGYMECAKNIFYFKETFLPKDKAGKAVSDYGAGASLVNNGTFTQEELEHVRGKSPDRQ